MNRRNFIAGLLAAVGGLALDPERALWVPGRKLISIPKPGMGIFNEPAVHRYLDLMMEEFFMASPLTSRVRILPFSFVTVRVPEDISAALGSRTP